MAVRGSKHKAVSTRGIAKARDHNKLTIDFDRYLPTVLSSLVAKFRGALIRSKPPAHAALPANRRPIGSTSAGLAG